MTDEDLKAEFSRAQQSRVLIHKAIRLLTWQCVVGFLALLILMSLFQGDPKGDPAERCTAIVR
jgi:hypothetical protein